jgi:hypothetical protein
MRVAASTKAETQESKDYVHATIPAPPAERPVGLPLQCATLLPDPIPPISSDPVLETRTKSRPEAPKVSGAAARPPQPASHRSATAASDTRRNDGECHVRR